MEPHKPSASFEEYKTLRAEILRNFDAVERNMLACITANGVALAYGVKENSALVLLLACIFPAYFWIRHSLYRSAIAKLSAYISVFLESSDLGLMWETRGHQVDLLGYERRKFAHVAKVFLLPYPILLIVSIVAILETVDMGSLSSLWILGAALLVTLAIVLLAKLASSDFALLREGWLLRYQKIKAQEESLSMAGSPAYSPIRGTPNPGPQPDDTASAVPRG
jgi:hypothetical protein